MNKLALALVLTPVAFFAADETLPKAETVLDRFVEATGGKAVFGKNRNEEMHATIGLAAQGLKGEMTVDHAGPDKDPAVVEPEGGGKSEAGSNSGGGEENA